MPQIIKSEGGEKTLVTSTGLCGFGECTLVAAVDVKDGKMLRIRALPFDWKCKPEEFRPWKIEARGRVFQPPMKSLLVSFGLGYKKRIYSPNRILYPLKRVDWDPEGERNPQNRGRSKYIRISWDEALAIIVKELERVIKNYGPSAVLLQGDGHGEEKVVQGPHGCAVRLMDLLGGYTTQARNPDSWEGWYWGAKHVWGMEPVGLMGPYETNLFLDISKNTDMLLFQGGDPETTPRGFGGGHMPSRWSYWFTELGIKQLYICPDLNYGAAVHADKWIPILPNTDAALQLAIAYQWLTEGTYDEEYLKTHAHGYTKFFEYVLGKEDGIPKTPKWATEKTSIPSRTIKALARAWASRTTTVAHVCGGPYIRGAYSHEPARLEVLLLAMQGLGKPGIHQLIISSVETGLSTAYNFIHQNGGQVNPVTPGGVVTTDPASKEVFRGYQPFIFLQKQVIPKTMVNDAILKGSFTISGSSLQMTQAEEQFVKYTYPAEGCSPIHMIWSDTPCLMTCWNDSNRNAEAYRHASIEFFLVQHPWMENDCLFADIVLPVNTKFEEDDLGFDNHSYHFDTFFLSRKCIEPLGESKSDYEIVSMIAEKLGLLEEYTEGKSIEEWIKHGFDKSGLQSFISWEKLSENQYYVIPTDPDWQKYPAGMIQFYNDPEKHPLRTPTGKLEFESANLKKHFPDDKERPPVPHWIEKTESHDERLSSERTAKYPLLCQSNHPRWRVHAQCDDVTWFHEIETCKVRGPDGYLYEPIWINPTEAARRYIKTGDLVKVFNERGNVLCGAYITERIMPGVVYVDHGARYDPIAYDIDRGGAINTITPHNITSKNCAGMVVSGFLVEVERVNLDKLRKQYPEAFNRPYDKASRLRFERVLHEG